MTIRKISILFLALLLPFSMDAQKKKKKKVKKPVIEVVEEPQEDPRITNMREMTQQIVIIDSIVTDKERILPQLRLSSETGTLTTTDKFFGKAISGHAFLNEMGNKVYFSRSDADGHSHLYTSDKLGNSWSEATPLKGLNDGITDADYPFMMNDGLTFYFAARGEESIGGYDIFFTRYDSRSGQFLKPENIGMPFNSEANDYMYAADEQSGIGYFVSDRRQPGGRVCIYIFILPETRRSYDPSIYTEQQIRELADISSIADTWGDGKERQAALARLKAIGTTGAADTSKKVAKTNTDFIINDHTTYTSAQDFRSSKAANLYNELLKARERQATIEHDLQKARNRYARSNEDGRKLLSEVILHNEEQALLLSDTIHALEKQIRKEENITTD